MNYLLYFMKFIQIFKLIFYGILIIFMKLVEGWVKCLFNNYIK